MHQKLYNFIDVDFHLYHNVGEDAIAIEVCPVELQK